MQLISPSCDFFKFSYIPIKACTVKDTYFGRLFWEYNYTPKKGLIDLNTKNSLINPIIVSFRSLKCKDNFIFQYI